mgnify:CR=1 FL=1
MKSGRNRVSTDANANSYMNWLNRAVGTTMFLNTRSTILQLLSTLNFLGKPGNNIFQATAAFANQKQWKADYNKLWNSDYLSNRRDGAKFDVLADEIAEGSQGLNKILKFGFLPTRYADSFAIALGGAAYYRNRVNMLMKEGGKVEEELVYNASPKSFDKLGERTGLIYLATNKREAKAYADMNRGNVKNIYINKNQVASEKDLISTMEELGINTTEGSVYELIDPRFDDFYIGKDAMNKVTNALAEKGFKAAKYEDGAQVVSGKVESIVVFDKSAISDKKGTINSGMTQEQAEAQAMIDWRATAEESQQSSDPSKISEIQASSIGKIIYAFANTPFQYARITKRKLQDITSGRSAAAGTLRTDMQSILYYSVGQAIMFNALQSGLVALLNSDREEDEELKDEKYALMLERTLTSFAKSTGNPGAITSTLYAMMKEGYMQQTGKKRPDANAFAITATSISPPLNSKMRDLAGAYRAFNKIEEGDTFTPSLDNEALTMAGEVASFGGDVSSFVPKNVNYEIIKKFSLIK